MGEEVGYTGGCLCQGIQYKYTGKFEKMFNCHCGICRKATGAAFYTLVIAERSKFSITEAATMGTYQSSERIKRHFCTRCGCSFYDDPARFPDIVFLSASTLDKDPGCLSRLRYSPTTRLPGTSFMMTRWSLERGLMPNLERTLRQTNRNP